MTKHVTWLPWGHSSWICHLLSPSSEDEVRWSWEPGVSLYRYLLLTEGSLVSGDVDEGSNSLSYWGGILFSVCVGFSSVDIYQEHFSPQREQESFFCSYIWVTIMQEHRFVTPNTHSTVVTALGNFFFHRNQTKKVRDWYIFQISVWRITAN